jgi:hypothetical protein
VVGQTPSFAPMTWETVSGQIEWTRRIISSNGLYLLREEL